MIRTLIVDSRRKINLFSDINMIILRSYIFLLLIICSLGVSPRFYSSDTIYSGSTLFQNDYLSSTNDAYFAIMQRDGNLVVYTSRDFSPVNAQWSSNTVDDGERPYRLTLLENGNLVIFDANNRHIWSTHTAGFGVKPYHLIMQIDRNLVLYDGLHRPIWASNSTKWSRRNDH